MALRREEDVAVGVLEPPVSDVQLGEEEVRNEVERAEGGAEVSRAGALHCDEGVQPARVGKQRQLRVGVDVGCAEAIELGLRDEAQIRHVRPKTVADALPPLRASSTLAPRILAAGEDRDAFCGARWRVACVGAIDWLESRVGTRLGGTTVFALALVVFGLRSIALPVIPGRDFGTYVGYYVQMWDWHSVVPMAMLFRTPLAPLVIGGTLDLFGGWGLLVAMALLFAASVVLWMRAALASGRARPSSPQSRCSCTRAMGSCSTRPRASPWPLPHSPSGRSRLSRAWVAPGVGRFAVLGAATAVTALARPAFEVLVLVAALPLVLRLPWRARRRGAVACAGVAVAVLGSCTVLNGLRYTTTPSPAPGAFLPFYRTFTTDHIVRPETGRPRDSSQTR